MNNKNVNSTEIANFMNLKVSKGYKSGIVSYETPAIYVNQIEAMLTELKIDSIFNLVKCRFDKPLINVNEDKTENISYPRFLMQYETKIPKCLTQTFTFGLLVALDSNTPIIKCFSGLNTSACLNLSIFGAQNLSISFLKDSNYQRVFQDLKNWLSNHAEQAKGMIEKYNFLKETIVQNPHEFYGKLLEKTYIDKEGTQPVLDSFRSTLIDHKSPYYRNFSLANVLESITDTISEKKNFLNAPNESLYFYNTLLSLKN